MSVNLLIGLAVFLLALYVLAKLSKMLLLIVFGVFLAWLLLHPSAASLRKSLPFLASATVQDVQAV